MQRFNKYDVIDLAGALFTINDIYKIDDGNNFFTNCLASIKKDLQ